MPEQQPRFALKIFHKTLLAMVLVALIPIAGLVYTSGYQLEKDWRQHTNLNLALIASGLAGKVDGWVNMNLRVLREHAALPDIILSLIHI